MQIILVLSEIPEINEILAIEGDIAKESYNFFLDKMIENVTKLNKQSLPILSPNPSNPQICT